MLLAKKLSAVPWHGFESVADGFEHVVWVDLTSEFDSVDLDSRVGIGSKSYPVLFLLFHHQVLVLAIRDFSLGLE